jgi:alkylated DNA repair dioxygenase AlkB
MNATTLAPGILYFPRFIDDPDAALADVLGQVEFTQRSRKLYGRTVATPRMEAWHGPAPYRFGGSELPARALPPVLHALATRAQCTIADSRFDSCLVNLYRDGRDSVAWHADDEPEMRDPIIASVSLGAARPFLLQRKNPTPAIASAMLPNKLRVELEHGSMLVMLRGVQAEWVHCLPKQKNCERRVNLTFRDSHL